MFASSHSLRTVVTRRFQSVTRRALTSCTTVSTSFLPTTVALQCQCRFATSHSTSAGLSEAGGPRSAEARFTQSTPNFSHTSVQDMDDTAEAFAADIVTTPAVNVDFVQDVHGPWLVMTEDLQGELFVDHDTFVFYRPANGLGYGIGKMNVIGAGDAGTAFSMELETYTYQPTEAIVARLGVRYNVTGMVKKVTSKSASYETFSLIGFWKREDPNATGAASSPETSVEGHSGRGDVRSGAFNAAKLTPWDKQAANTHWSPNEELQNVFNHVFPQKLHLNSHLKRRDDAEAGARQAKDTVPAAAASRPDAEKALRHMDLAPFAVGTIPGIFYIPNYISEDEQREIVQRIRDTPSELKSPLKKRTVQEWGGTMCEECQQSFVADANMPPWVQQCTDMLTFDGLFTPTTFPNSVRIHEYQVGEGIGPHCDGPIYVPNVTVLSLASTVVMSFYPKQEPYTTHPMDHYNDTFKFDDGEIGKKVPLQSVVLEPRSLLVFSGDAYHYYPHGVSDKAVDELSADVAGDVVNRHLLNDKDVSRVERAYRASITTRNLLTRCNHQPARAEYAMKRAWYLYNQQPVPETLFMPSPVAEEVAAAAVSDDSQGKTSQPARLSTVSAHGGPLSEAALRRWEDKLDRLFTEQEALRKSVDGLTQALALSLSSDAAFKKEVSTVLNHLSSTVLELDTKMEDLGDAVGELTSK